MAALSGSAFGAMAGCMTDGDDSTETGSQTTTEVTSPEDTDTETPTMTQPETQKPPNDTTVDENGTPVFNGMAYPRPEDGGQGIQTALDNYQYVFLRPGVYKTDIPIDIPGHRTIKGAGEMEMSTISAQSEIPYVLSGLDGKYHQVYLGDFHIHGENLATNCLQQLRNNFQWHVENLRIEYAKKDNIVVDGGFNSKYESVRTRAGRHAVNIFNTDLVIVSSMLFEKCHFGETKSHVFTIGQDKYMEERVVVNVKIDHCDISGATTFQDENAAAADLTGRDGAGIYIGRHAGAIQVSQVDVEFNPTGIQIGTTDAAPSRPSRILLMGGKGTGNPTLVDVQSGEQVTLINLSGVGGNTSAKFRENAGDRIYELNNDWANGVERDTRTVSPFGQAGTKAPMNAMQMRSQDLSTEFSSGVGEIRLHNGADGNPVGLYRGDGEQGWVKVSDNSVSLF